YHAPQRWETGGGRGGAFPPRAPPQHCPRPKLGAGCAEVASGQRPMSEEDEGPRCRMVAIHDFDPNTLDWPFENQQPLALHIGDVVEATYDPGSEWALGHLAGMPERSGYFPTNYCAPLEEYEQSFEEMDRSGQISPDLDDVQPAPSRGQQSRVAGSSRQQVPAGHQSPSRLGVPQPTGQQADQGTPRSVVSVRSPRSGEGGSVVSGLRISPHDSQ
ncbi:unnamed protein product, partial [Polarella glacialis]